jgi:uncharacterized Zn finger protein
MPTTKPPPRTVYRCSFCGKSQEQVHRLIAGPGGVYICNECIVLCQGILDEEHAGKADPSTEAQKPTVATVARAAGEMATQVDHLSTEVARLAGEVSALAAQVRSLETPQDASEAAE